MVPVMGTEVAITHGVIAVIGSLESTGIVSAAHAIAGIVIQKTIAIKVVVNSTVATIPVKAIITTAVVSAAAGGAAAIRTCACTCA